MTNRRRTVQSDKPDANRRSAVQPTRGRTPMGLGTNEHDARDLARYLKTVHIPAGQLVVGDILVGDHCIWRIAKITRGDKTHGPTAVVITEQDDNGTSMPPDWKVEIIDRTCLATRLVDGVATARQDPTR